MKWIVFWVLISYTMVSVPPQKNEFGIIEGWGYQETQMVYDTLSKVFDSADSAVAFIERSRGYWYSEHVLAYNHDIKKIWMEPYNEPISFRNWVTGDSLRFLTDTLDLSPFTLQGATLYCDSIAKWKIKTEGEK
jgi:hypothetical protein